MVGGRGGLRKPCGPWRLLGNVAHGRGAGVLKFQLSIHSFPSPARRREVQSERRKAAAPAPAFQDDSGGIRGMPGRGRAHPEASGKCSPSLAGWGLGAGETEGAQSRAEDDGV